MPKLCTLNECPPGVFSYNGVLGFKTEYGRMEVDPDSDVGPGYLLRWKMVGGPEAYVLASGEYFWGGAKTIEELGSLMVIPLDIEDVFR